MAAKQFQIPVKAGFQLSAALDLAKDRLTREGYDVETITFSPESGKLKLSKDMSGAKKFVGMGVESEASITIMSGNVMNVTVENLWSNKIIALAVGWILCWVPFVTGCIGCSNQSKLPQKIEDTMKGVIMTLGVE